jgi:hypothetical protein
MAVESVDPVRFTDLGSDGVRGSVDDCCATAIPIVSHAAIVIMVSFFIYKPPKYSGGRLHRMPESSAMA